MSIATLVKDGLTEESAFGLLDMRGVKGLRVLMQGAWDEFKAKCIAGGIPVDAAVDHLIETGGHLEGFQPRHMCRPGPGPLLTRITHDDHTPCEF